MALSAYLGKPKSIAADLNTMLIAACVVKRCCSVLCELSLGAPRSC
jgi:hypothetical protein